MIEQKMQEKADREALFDIKSEMKNFALINETIDLREELKKLPTQLDMDLQNETMRTIND